MTACPKTLELKKGFHGQTLHPRTPCADSHAHLGQSPREILQRTVPPKLILSEGPCWIPNNI